MMNLQMKGGTSGISPTKDTLFYGRSIYVAEKTQNYKYFALKKNNYVKNKYKNIRLLYNTLLLFFYWII